MKQLFYSWSYPVQIHYQIAFQFHISQTTRTALYNSCSSMHFQLIEMADYYPHDVAAFPYSHFHWFAYSHHFLPSHFDCSHFLQNSHPMIHVISTMAENALHSD